MFQKISKIILVLIWTTIAGLAHANIDKEIGWDDLVPAENDIMDPDLGLNDDQMYVFIEALLIRDMIVAGEDISEDDKKLYKEYRAELESQKVDVDKLFEDVDYITEQRRNMTFETNVQLDGTRIRMPGYMLPLEFEGKLVTEFLLVPYVGACIHTPPPPANQIIHVKSEKGFEPGSRFFSPVWVTGLMEIEGKKIDTDMVDGSVEIYSSYSMPDAAVEAYSY